MAPPLPSLAFASCEGDQDGDVSERAGEKVALLSAAASPQQIAWLSRLELGAGDDAMSRDVGEPSLSFVKGERASPRMSDEWEVIAPLGPTAAACCGGARKPRVVELVTLRHANFGLRWAGATAKKSHRHSGHQQRRAKDDEDKTASPPFCMVGPHWWLMAATYSVLLIAALSVTVLTIPQAGSGEAATGVLLSAACLTMYAKVACSNPGIVEHLDEPLHEDYTYCGECESYRPPE
jgi:hypothetical protein